MASINVASHSQKKAVEPSMYVDMEKICKRCKQSNVKFKFLNNKKQNQPRYQCQDCTLELGKPYHFNPFPIREHNHKDGYAKLPKVETGELKNFNKVCDKCQAENNATFRGYNNGKETQPRYACQICRHLFSPLKNSKATSTKTDVSSYEFETAGAQHQETGASQQPSNIDVSSYEFETAGAPYQEMGALQQPSSIDVSSYEFETIGAQHQETGALQQPNNIDVSSYEFQTAGAPYQKIGASQQPSNIDASPYEFQTRGSQYQETAGASQQPLPYNTLYEQTSISYQQYNYYNPYGQSSDNHPVSIKDVDGSSNQYPFPWQNAESSQWQQPTLYNTSFDQHSISSQQHSYDFPHCNQSSDNRSLASVGVVGSSNQFPIPSQNAESSQWQQPSLYIDQTSISSQQHSCNCPHCNQSSDNRSLASANVVGSSNQYPFPSQNAESSQWQQPSLYIDQTSISSQQHSYDYPHCNQSSGNRSLASADVAGSSNQYPFPSQNAEALQRQQPPLYNNTLYDQTSISSQQHSYDYPHCNQSSDNHSLASMNANGSSNQYSFPLQNAEAWQWQQPSLYTSVDVDGFSNQFPIPLHDADAWQQASLYNPLGQ